MFVHTVIMVIEPHMKQGRQHKLISTIFLATSVTKKLDHNTPEFKKKIVRLHEEEGRTYKSITAEYGVSKASISKWCSEFSKECQSSPEAKEDYDNMKEMLRLKRENEELRKENLFLKKAAAFFAKEID